MCNNLKSMLLVCALFGMLTGCGGDIEPLPAPLEVYVHVDEDAGLPCLGAAILTLEARTYDAQGVVIKTEDLSPDHGLFFNPSTYACDLPQSFKANVDPGDRVAFFAELLDSSGRFRTGYGWTSDQTYWEGVHHVTLPLQRDAYVRTLLIEGVPSDLLALPVNRLFLLLEHAEGGTIRSHEVDLLDGQAFPYVFTGLEEKPASVRFEAFNASMTSIYAEAFPLTFTGDLAVLDFL